MPIYEYKCENGHVFDVMQKMSEDPLTECVECGAPVRKVLQPVGISFKGSGFYSTDYSKKSAKTDSKETKETKETVKSGESSTNGAAGSGDSGSGDGVGKKPEKTSTEPAKKGD
jgi:putative FmdB family regulatory protein